MYDVITIPSNEHTYKYESKWQDEMAVTNKSSGFNFDLSPTA
jgi:hypothetical protein